MNTDIDYLQKAEILRKLKENYTIALALLHTGVMYLCKKNVEHGIEHDVGVRINYTFWNFTVDLIFYNLRR